MRSPVSIRSVALGLLGVAFICCLSAYNDWVVNNTYLVGNFLPIGLLLFFLVFITLINAPLRRWWPRFSLTGRELAVALAMMLISCGLPGAGLMRYLPPQLVGVWRFSGERADYAKLMSELNLPDWMWPTFAEKDAQRRAADPIVANYYGRVPIASDRFIDRFAAVPWRAWMTPAITWGIFLIALLGATLCLALLVRRQWIHNERLPFPLAQVYLSMTEEPARGHAVNALFRSRAFWIAFLAVFALHGINALHLYDPQHWPTIPVAFDLTDVLSSPPWSAIDASIKKNTIYFCVIGITFFLQTKVAFSMWFFVLLVQAVRMLMVGSYQIEPTPQMRNDQIMGGMAPFALLILWVGRREWMLIARQMFRGVREDEDPGKYLSNRIVGWCFAACGFAMITWLIIAGASIIGAIVLVILIHVMLLVMMRVIAETGLIAAQMPMSYTRPWIVLANLPDGLAARTTMRSFFFSSMFYGFFGHDPRESPGVFASHALKVGDDGAYPESRGWRATWPFMAALGLALLVGTILSAASMLYVEYSYASTLDRQQLSPISQHAVEPSVRDLTLQSTLDYRPPKAGPLESHNRVGHMLLGGGIVAVLSALRLNFAAFPLHPVGYLLAYTYPMQITWFSIFVGWLAKVMIVRFGGTRVFRDARLVFLGLILGEAGAAAFWLMVCLARSSMGLEYHAVRLLPN